MLIGQRVREMREAKSLSQGDIEHRTGLIRCYVSRVENGHTVPALETMEKFARALEIPLYQLFYGANEPPQAPQLRLTRGVENVWGNSGREARELARFRRALSRMTESRRQLLLALAHRMVRRNR